MSELSVRELQRQMLETCVKKHMAKYTVNLLAIGGTVTTMGARDG